MLTDEQRARIERNRQEALARRARLHDQPARPAGAGSGSGAASGCAWVPAGARPPGDQAASELPVPLSVTGAGGHGGTGPGTASGAGRLGSASAPAAARQQQRISFAPLGGGQPAASNQPSLRAQLAANLQHDREVQDRCRAAAAEKQGKDRQHDPGVDLRKRPGPTQSLLAPMPAPVSVCPESSLKVDMQDYGTNAAPKGPDLESAKTLLMPSSGREYQRNIIQTAVLRNTLVSLPTGMGKTFIAAVVMFNYLRWFPGKIVVFLAPTKPLAKQQVDAVYQLVGIPKSMTTLMTGDCSPELRKNQWQVRGCLVAVRVHVPFFLSPYPVAQEPQPSTTQRAPPLPLLSPPRRVLSQLSQTHARRHAGPSS